MGYAIDQDGIVTRYEREKDNWDSHLRNSKKEIIEFAEKQKINSLLILGSGWLLDIPVEHLQEQNIEVHFVDIVQPYQIRYKHRNQKNFHFHELDALGDTAQRVYADIKSDTFSANSFRTSELQTNFKFDAVISLNLLNQLDILLVDYIKDKKTLSEDEEKSIRTQIQQSHLDFLSKHKYCLISDTTQTSELLEGGEIQNELLVHIPLPNAHKKNEWTWMFDMSGNYIEHRSVQFKVEVFQSI